MGLQILPKQQKAADHGGLLPLCPVWQFECIYSANTGE
jgi:hypothetical protein